MPTMDHGWPRGFGCCASGVRISEFLERMHHRTCSVGHPTPTPTSKHPAPPAPPKFNFRPAVLVHRPIPRAFLEAVVREAQEARLLPTSQDLFLEPRRSRVARWSAAWWRPPVVLAVSTLTLDEVAQRTLQDPKVDPGANALLWQGISREGPQPKIGLLDVT